VAGRILAILGIWKVWRDFGRCVGRGGEAGLPLTGNRENASGGGGGRPEWSQNKGRG
jgi:hypothetical protein